MQDVRRLPDHQAAPRNGSLRPAEFDLEQVIADGIETGQESEREVRDREGRLVFLAVAGGSEEPDRILHPAQLLA